MPMEYLESIIDLDFLLLAELLIKDMKLMKMENGLLCASVLRCWVSVGQKEKLISRC